MKKPNVKPAAAQLSFSDRIRAKVGALEAELLRNPFRLQVPPPARIRQVGEAVRVGRLPEGRVEAVLGEGRFVVVSNSPPSSRDNPAPSTAEEDRDVGVWPAHDARPIAEGASRFRKDYSQVYYSQRSVSDLISKVFEFGVDFDPPYQRGRVWDDADKQLLLNSIFHGADIGKFVVLSRDFEYGPEVAPGVRSILPGYEILDGKQRLSTLVEFLQDGFAYEGFRFSEMSAADQRYLTSYPISMAEIPKASVTEADILRLFLRMNMGGRPQDPAHLARLQAELDQLEAPAPKRPAP